MYKFYYKDGDTEVTYEMSEECNVYELAENLQRFLLACSWQKCTLDNVFKDIDN